MTKADQISNSKSKKILNWEIPEQCNHVQQLVQNLESKDPAGVTLSLEVTGDPGGYRLVCLKCGARWNRSRGKDDLQTLQGICLDVRDPVWIQKYPWLNQSWTCHGENGITTGIDEEVRDQSHGTRTKSTDSILGMSGLPVVPKDSLPRPTGLGHREIGESTPRPFGSEDRYRALDHARR